MSAFNLVLARVPAGARPGVTMTPEAEPAYSWNPTLTSSSQQSAAASFAEAGEYCWVATAGAADVALSFGTDPDVTSDYDWIVPANQTRDFAARTGQKGAAKLLPAS